MGKNPSLTVKPSSKVIKNTTQVDDYKSIKGKPNLLVPWRKKKASTSQSVLKFNAIPVQNLNITTAGRLRELSQENASSS